MSIVLDTETTGLPLTPSFGEWYHPRQVGYYNKSRVVQVALVSDSESYKWNIIPEGFTIHNSHFHGVTQELAEQGTSWRAMTRQMMLILSKYDKVVGHNLSFDICVVAAEMYRRDNPDLAERFMAMARCDTMKMGRRIMGRNPKLVHLYEHLFHTPVIQTHDAFDDCVLTLQCYNKMKSLF